MADNKLPEGRTYGAQPSLSPQADPDSDEFQDPFASSNEILGYPEAAGSNRPTNWTPEDEKKARAEAQRKAAKPKK